MDRNIVENIRLQADDLRDELKELEQWEEMTIQREQSGQSRKVAQDDTVEPPIRGTVPSLKDAVAASAKAQGKKTPSHLEQIQAAKEKGNEYFRTGKIADAIQAYTSGINVDPDGAETHVLYGNRSMCYLKEMNWDPAEKDATTCLRLNRAYAKGYYRRALARKNLGKLKEARADVESVLALVPGDQSAKTELEVITKMLQVQRAKESAGGPSVKKKIVIEEVDDEDEDEQGEAGNTSALSAEEERERQARIQQHMAEVDKARRAQEEAARAAALRAEREQSMRQRAAQSHSRMEIIEDEDEQVPKFSPKVTASPAKEAPPTPAATPTAPAVHADPTVSVGAKTTTTTQVPKPAPKAAAAASPPTQLRSNNVNKESLVAPKTFTEFERTFNTIKDNQDLLNYYVGLMNPAGMATLFKSNMSPAMLSGIVTAIAQFPGSTGFQFLKGLSKVNRVDELTLFFSEPEKKKLTDALNLAKSSGADSKEVDALQKKLMPF